MQLKMVATAALLAACAPSFVAPSAAAELRWKFKPGETLDYVLSRKMDGKLTLSGADIAFTLSMAFDTAWKATEVADDGTANIELTVDRIQVVMNSPLFGKMAYDSKNAKEPEGPVWQQMKPVMNGMLGQTFQAKISPRGEVSDIKLPEKLTAALAAQEIGENRRQGFGIGSSGFDKKGIQELIVKSVLPLPETSNADVKWKQSFENAIPMIGTQFTETTFSEDGTETVDGKELAKIKAETELFFEPIENPRAELEIMEQDASATFLFDAEAGHLVSADGKQRANMELSGPQELTQDITETMSMKLGKSPDEPAGEASQAGEK